MHAVGMTDRDDFLAWVKTALYDAELALHNGNAGPRQALWSRHEPVSVLGAWRNAFGRSELDELFTALGDSFSDCTSYEFELLSYDWSEIWRTRPASSTHRPRSTASPARTRCARPSCIAVRTVSGRSPIGTGTP